MKTIYDFRTAARRMTSVQGAPTTTQDFGFELTDGRFRSPEWWDHVRAGRLPTITVRGVITRLYMGSMNDWPEFEMRADDGTLYAWSRYADDATLGSLYRQGKRVEVDYVVQRFRTEPADRGTDLKCVVAVRLDETP